MYSLLPLRTKINRTVYSIALLVFPVIILASALLYYQTILDDTALGMRARIDVAKDLFKKTLYNTDIFLQSILSSEPPSNLEKIFKRIVESHYFERSDDSVYILDASGRVLFIPEPYTDFNGLDFSAMLHPKSGSKRVVHHFQSLLTKRSVVAIQYRLDNGCFLVVERNLEDFTPIMASFKQGQLFPGEILFVLSETGRTIYHPDHYLVATRYNLGFEIEKHVSPDRHGIFSFIYKGNRFVAMRERFQEPSDWVIYYSVPSASIFYRVASTLSYQLFFLLLLLFLLIFTLHIVFVRFFSTPVSNIVSELEKEKGAGAGLPIELAGGVAEFATIIKGINSRERAVVDTAERFQAVLNSLDAVVYVADMETYEILFINSYGKKIAGDCIGKPCYLAIQRNQESPCPFCTNEKLVDEEGKPTGIHVWEFQNTLNNRWYECRDQAIRWTDGRLVRMEIATDITARKEAEQALLEEKERLSVTLRSIGDGVITTDIHGKIVLINRIAEELTGWTNEEAVGRDSSEVFNIINERTGEKCASPIQQVIRFGRIVGLANHTALVARDGTVRSIADSGAPIRDSKSRIIGVVLVFRDITKEKRMEEELLKIKKLESVGVLAGGIAHDFNNILSAILGNIELVATRIKDDTKNSRLLEDACKATKRATKLTQQLLTFAKGGVPVREATSLPELIRESADFVLHGSPIRCNYRFAPDLWSVNVDAGQIGQVIQNIVLNAVHAMPGGGEITIACSNVTDPASETLLSVDKGRYVRITIKDSGVGIPRKVIDKIFDPYFSTKQEGSGLGLAICHSIINKHEGLITVDSEPGEGTLFTIYLPSAEDNKDAVDHSSTTRPRTVKSARILVMDDDEMVLQVVKEQLQALGHKTITAKDGEEAINRYQELQDSGTPVDLVIMDLTVIGGVGGREAAKRLLDIDPGAKIVVSSGYSNDPIMANFRDYGFRAAITKPFDLQELNGIITSVLSP